MVVTNSVCGVIGGFINIGVGLASIPTAIGYLKKGNLKVGIPALCDVVCLTVIGFVMILTSLARHIPGVHGLGTFLNDRPWILPVIFLVITLPLITQILMRVKNIVTRKDLASGLNLKAIKICLNKLSHLHKEMGKSLDKAQITEDKAAALNQQTIAFEASVNAQWNFIQTQIGWFIQNEETLATLSEKMEDAEKDMGVSCAIYFFKFFETLQKGDIEKSLELLPKVEHKVKAWNKAQWVRLTQQVLFIIAFILSMGTFIPKAPASLLNGASLIAIAGGNAIPLYMDCFWPFKRNTPIAVP